MLRDSSSKSFLWYRGNCFMNNVTQLPIYKVRAVFCEQRLKPILSPERRAGQIRKVRPGWLGRQPPVFDAEVQFWPADGRIFLSFSQSAPHHCKKTTLCFLPCRKLQPWSNLTDVGIKSTSYGALHKELSHAQAGRLVHTDVVALPVISTR